MDHQEVDVEHEQDQAGSDTCESGNEPLSSIKCRKLLYWLKPVTRKDSALWNE